MALLDHLGITVAELGRGREQFHPVFDALGYVAGYGDDHSLSWNKDGETEMILMAPREPDPVPHEHGRVGWQHLAFAVHSRAEVERTHAVALDAGWTAVRPPKEYPRFSDRYYASFVEEDSGIRIEFMFNLAPRCVNLGRNAGVHSGDRVDGRRTPHLVARIGDPSPGSGTSR